MHTAEWLQEVNRLANSGADTSRKFLYLAGPMTGIPHFNFPMFDRVARDLRRKGLNIVSPAELDDPAHRDDLMDSKDGVQSKQEWASYLARDIVICAMPTCRGAVFMDGWEKSKGAQLEHAVIKGLNKPRYKYNEYDGSS
jgi:hypothetical protein